MRTEDSAAVVAETSGVSAGPTITPTADTSEERWAAWQARGDAHDRVTRRRMAIAVPILLAAGLVVSGWLFL